MSPEQPKSNEFPDLNKLRDRVLAGENVTNDKMTQTTNTDVSETEDDDSHPKAPDLDLLRKLVAESSHDAEQAE